MDIQAPPDIEAARAYALDRLLRELPASFYYHAATHTRDEVEPAAVRIATLEGVSSEELILVRTAALYHDTGYIYGTKDHEAASIEIAGNALPEFHYNSEQIKRIQAMIRATRMPQMPANLLERIVVDADLDILGQENYLERSLDLREELAALGNPIGIKQWYRRQLQFLKKHHYHTDSQRRLREPCKQRNIELLQQAIKSAAHSS